MMLFIYFTPRATALSVARDSPYGWRCFTVELTNKTETPVELRGYHDGPVRSGVWRSFPEPKGAMMPGTLSEQQDIKLPEESRCY
jgi:hypothetical protein